MSEEIITNEEVQDVHELKRIRMDKLAALKAEGNDPFAVTSYDVTAHSETIKTDYTELEERLKAENPDEEALKTALEENRHTVRIAGRIMSRRDMGKANFINVLDRDGSIQVYVRTNDVGADLFKSFKTWDLGDIIGVEGYPFRTRTGEITIHATSIVLLTKSLLPLPEKWHGLKDQDMRYRQRYVDLIVNREVT